MHQFTKMLLFSETLCIYIILYFLFYLGIYFITAQRALMQNQNFAWGQLGGKGKGTGAAAPATPLEPPML